MRDFFLRGYQEFLFASGCRSGGNVVSAIDSTPTGGFRATITDASGREVLTIDLADSDRFILSSDRGKIVSRKLGMDDHYWSRDTLREVVREMTSKN